MLELTTGNLLEAPVEALVNTVNTVGVMGKGVALQFREAFPENFALYKAACKRNEVVPGRMFVTTRLGNPRFIINFPTKRHWKGKSRMKDIDAGLEALVEVVRREAIESIAIPPLGCGNGGLHWNQVRLRIEEAFGALPDVSVLLFEPGGAPNPDEMPVATEMPNISVKWATLLAVMMDYGEIGYRLTKLEAQKLAYFLQEDGVQLGLPFRKEQYGPYAEELNHVLQRFEGHFLRGYGDRSREASIRVLPAGRDAALRLLADDDASAAVGDVDEDDEQGGQHGSPVEHVHELIEGFKSPHCVELLATVHWVVKEDRTVGTDVDTVIKRVHEWSERKARTFPEHHIRVAHAHLAQLGWI